MGPSWMVWQQLSTQWIAAATFRLCSLQRRAKPSSPFLTSWVGATPTAHHALPLLQLSAAPLRILQ